MGKNNIYTKQQAIEKIVNDVDGWDLENVVEFAKEMWANQLEKLTLEEIESELNHTIGTYDADEESDEYCKVIDTKASRLLIDGVKK